MSETVVAPPYRRLVESLRQRISAGEFPVGSMLPPMRELARSYQFPESSVRTAIALLDAERIVTTRPGKGVFVRTAPVTDPAGMAAVHATLTDQDEVLRDLVRRVVDLERLVTAGVSTNPVCVG